MVEYDPAEGDNPGEPVIGLLAISQTHKSLDWLRRITHPPPSNEKTQYNKIKKVESCIYVFRAEAP